MFFASYRRTTANPILLVWVFFIVGIVFESVHPKGQKKGDWEGEIRKPPPKSEG
jgi:hypothetical protein